MSVDEHIFFETKEAYSYTLNRTQLTIIKKLSENKDCNCFIDIIEQSIKKINYLINHINGMKNFIMTPQDCSKENEAYQYIICKLFCMHDYILFFINNLDIVIDNFTNILENNKLIDDFIKHIEDYQPSSSLVSNSIITYDFSSFLNFLLIQEFYKKQKEVYSNIEQVDNVDLDKFNEDFKSYVTNIRIFNLDKFNEDFKSYVTDIGMFNLDKFNEDFKSYVTDIRKFILDKFNEDFKSYVTDIGMFNLDELTDPKYLSELKYNTNKYELYVLFSRFINASEKNGNYISKIKGHHNIIYYLKKFTENLEGMRLNINNNHYLEALSYIQLMLSKNAEQLKNTVKLKYSLYSTITDKLFSVTPGNKNYVYYDPTLVLTRIRELYIHVLNYINSVVKPIV